MKAHSFAKGHQGPGLKKGRVGTSGFVCLRSSHLQVISLGALKKRIIWSLDIKSAFPRADGFGRQVFLRAPVEWAPEGTHRFRKLHAPACRLHDAPAAFFRAPRRFSLNSVNPFARAALKPQISSSGPCLYIISRKVARRGEPSISSEVRRFPDPRFGTLEVQEQFFVHVGVEL